jgi:hypothetical protein
MTITITRVAENAGDIGVNRDVFLDVTAVQRTPEPEPWKSIGGTGREELVNRAAKKVRTCLETLAATSFQASVNANPNVTALMTLNSISEEPPRIVIATRVEAICQTIPEGRDCADVNNPFVKAEVRCKELRCPNGRCIKPKQRCDGSKNYGALVADHVSNRRRGVMGVRLISLTLSGHNMMMKIMSFAINQDRLMCVIPKRFPKKYNK